MERTEKMPFFFLMKVRHIETLYLKQTTKTYELGEPNRVLEKNKDLFSMFLQGRGGVFKKE